MAVRQLVEERPEWPLLRIDRKNAFNEILRAEIIRELMELEVDGKRPFLALARYAFAYYAPESHILLNTPGAPMVADFLSSEGGQQRPTTPLIGLRTRTCGRTPRTGSNTGVARRSGRTRGSN